MAWGFRRSFGDLKIENKDAVQPAFGVGDQRRTDAAMIGMVLIGGKRRPVVKSTVKP